MQDARDWIARRTEPRFILPTRFQGVSFDSFEVDPGYNGHTSPPEQVRRFVSEAGRQHRRFRWRDNGKRASKGLFLVGPPGVGKTHLLAAGYRASSEPKLFATFDELVAAAGPLGMERLAGLVSEPRLVCIDEVVLEDPANIMMLVTLLQHMIESGVHVLASANMLPGDVANHDSWLATFERELGQITSAFDIERLNGRDRRADLGRSANAPSNCSGPTLRASWDEIDAYLRDTHPMHDAAWLERIRRLEIAGDILPPVDRDRALRFVRFIDRVYDRGVELRAGERTTLEPAALVEPLEGDPRYIWHVARGKSRLVELLGSNRG